MEPHANQGRAVGRVDTGVRQSDWQNVRRMTVLDRGIDIRDRL